MQCFVIFLLRCVTLPETERKKKQKNDIYPRLTGAVFCKNIFCVRNALQQKNEKDKYPRRLGVVFVKNISCVRNAVAAKIRKHDLP